MFALRSLVQFTLDNLQFYMQVDVLDTLFLELLGRTASHRSLEALQREHKAFLDNVVARCFVNDRYAMHISA